MNIQKNKNKNNESKPKVLLLSDHSNSALLIAAINSEKNCELEHIPSEEELYKKFSIEVYAGVIINMTFSDDKSYGIANKLSKKYKTEKVPIILILNKPASIILEEYEFIDIVYNPFNPTLISTKITIFILLFKNRKEKMKQLDNDIKKAEFEIHETKVSLPMTDNLTGLMTSYAFKKTAEYIILSSLRYKRKLALILFTLNNSNSDLDTKYDKKTLDRLLKIVSSILKKVLRKEDLISRQSYVFSIITTDLNEYNDVIAVVNKLKRIYKAVYKIHEQSISVSLSIGISFLEDSIGNFESLTDTANHAMKKSIAAGNACEIFTDNLFKTEKANDATENKLLTALHNNEFYIVYQPIIDMKQNCIIGLQALLRWNNDTEGLISPGVFIPLVEKNDNFYDIGLWLLNKVSEQISIWKKYKFNNELFVTVNISKKQLEKQCFKDDLRNILIKNNVVPIHLEMELTNLSDQSNKKNSVNQNLLFLKQTQLSLSLNEENINSSALSDSMSRIEATIKINSKIIQNGETGQDMVRNIIDYANNLSLKVKAVCVETEEQKKFLVEKGCILGQGFYFYKPMKTEEVTAVLNKL